ncbi:MAG: GlsB/YeaQ/YmgE family stress response membrane protein [Planctomycetaceae bacterium]|nr:GlsB/YeaQ/YmgE family stress response membrane protein [Planctomycetaceae bacterium]
MDVLYAILAWAVFGLISGAVARLLVPGRQPIGLLATMFLGVVGSIVGGGLTWLVTGEPMQPAGWIMSIVGAVVVLLIAVKTGSKRFVG